MTGLEKYHDYLFLAKKNIVWRKNLTTTYLRFRNAAHRCLPYIEAMARYKINRQERKKL